MTLNETMSMKAAKTVGERMWKEGGPDDTSRIACGFKPCTGRAPTPNESNVLLTMLHRHEQKKGANSRHKHSSPVSC